MNRKYRVAIVGCGNMGVGTLDKSLPFIYNHAEAALKDPRVEIVALVDSNIETAIHAGTKLRNEFGQDNIWIGTSLSQATRRPSASLGDPTGELNPIDIVCCSAGPEANMEVIRAAKEVGIRGVFCEKPLTLSLENTDEIIRNERETGLKILVDYHRNSDKFHRNVVDFIRKGGLGNLLYVRILYKGGIIAVAPHAFALLELLFDKPLSASGTFSALKNTRCEGDPNINGTVRYSYGPENRAIDVSVMATGRGEVEGNCTYIFELEFTGTKGRVSVLENGARLRFEEMRPSRITPSHGDMMPYQTEKIPLDLLPSDGPRDSLVEGFKRLVDAIESNTATPCNAATAGRAEEVAHAMAVSAGLIGQTVELPLADGSHCFSDFRAGTKVLLEENKGTAAK